MNAALGFVLLFLFYGWLCLSVVIWIYWHCRQRPYDGFLWLSRHTAIALGFLLGIFLLLWPGFEAALFFIPSSWTVRTGEAEHTSLRNYWGGFLAFISTGGLFSLLDTTAKLRRENNDLRKGAGHADE